LVRCALGPGFEGEGELFASWRFAPSWAFENWWAEIHLAPVDDPDDSLILAVRTNSREYQDLGHDPCRGVVLLTEQEEIEGPTSIYELVQLHHLPPEACTPPGVLSADFDQDGYSPEQGDCDDHDPRSNPGAEEHCDGVDNDCDEAVDEGCLDTGDDSGAHSGDTDDELDDEERGCGCGAGCLVLDWLAVLSGLIALVSRRRSRDDGKLFPSR
jgi:hypothetical protein